MFTPSPNELPLGQTKPPATPSVFTLGEPPATEKRSQPNKAAQPTYSGTNLGAERQHESRPASDPASAPVSHYATTVNTETRAPDSPRSALTVPQIQIDDEGALPVRGGDKSWLLLRSSKSKKRVLNTDPAFRGITLDIPTGSLGDDIPTDSMEFSNRGSMLIGGHKLSEIQSSGGHAPASGSNGRRPASNSSLRDRPSPKVLSTDEELLSQKVRSCYEIGTDVADEQDGASPARRSDGLRPSDGVDGTESDDRSSTSKATSVSDLLSSTSVGQLSGLRRGSIIKREENELAGGLEDWQDVKNDDVDRYGFIVPKRSHSERVSNGLMNRSYSSRTSPNAQPASDTPRRRRMLRKSPTKYSIGNEIESNPPQSTRPISAQSSTRGSFTSRKSSFRHAANRLPYNKTRRLMDEASDMLNLPRGAADPSTEGDLGGQPGNAKRKETEREEKWRKMARVLCREPHGGGTVFDFDTKSPKLIERTWKGIPDRWRGTAWHAFLSASAKKWKDSLSDEELVEMFQEYQQQASPDDVQIDIDVPRTISSHIMFRRRYRGGQRLLFRVLHAMSLHFPETGYVQGMAALAVTLLAYYDEENAFIMLVRLWELRGLDKIYKSGFGGLMQALDDFENKWLGGGEVGAKLTELGISPTAYGTRWYLTLFHYSIPFPAQLRVWDVFMLLGDDEAEPMAASPGESGGFGTSLDVLHATSAALIDGLRDVLLASDFETVMKLLTSWIAVQDEDLFMRIAKTEWKMHRRKG